MTYGLVGDSVDTYGPTIQGMKHLRESVLVTGDKFPVLVGFVEEGGTTDPKQLAIECRQLLRKCSDEDLKETLLHLAKTASKCKKSLQLC